MAMLLERYLNRSPAAASLKPPSTSQPGTNPLTAFSAYQPAAPMDSNAYYTAAETVHALQTAHLHSQLHAALLAATREMPPHAFDRGLPTFSPRSPQTSGGGSDRSLETQDERREPPGLGVAGLKIPVTCNDVRGLVYLDQQVVGCYCPSCEARVAAGHDRPLFSFTRFERHCGSKAKKWRLSLRIEPGSVKECPHGDGPMSLGQWMEMKGLMSWGARNVIKIGMRESDDDETLMENGTYLRRGPVGPVDERRAAGALTSLAGGPSASPAPYAAAGGSKERDAPGNCGMLRPMTARDARLPVSALHKRDRDEYETPNLPDQADTAAWLQQQLARFNAEASPPQQQQQPHPQQQKHEQVGGSEGKSGAGGEQEGGAAEAAVAPVAAAGSGTGVTNTAGKHGAIFKLVYGLLEGVDRRAFNEVYLPWLNELPAPRLDQEFNTLRQYLQLLDDMSWQAVQGQMRAYLRAILSRVQRK